MKFQYKFPTQVFLIFETLKPTFFTSKFLPANHFCLYINNSWFFGLNFLFRNELHLNKNFLVESSALDFNGVNYKWIADIFKKSPNQILLFFVYYYYYLKLKVSLFTFFEKKSNAAPLPSIEQFYFNANWLEREVSEMFGVFFSKKLDNRILLLDYGLNENPMLRSFPCDGFFETYYNFFENNVSALEVELVEL